MCTDTKKWVRRTLARLNGAKTADERGTAPFEQLIETYYQVLLIEVKNLRVKVTGGSTTYLRYRSRGHQFLRALVIFAARCGRLKYFPTWFRLARAKFIPRPEEGACAWKTSTPCPHEVS